MRALLEFNLPEDLADLESARCAPELHAAFDDLRNHVRNRLKHGELSDAARAELEAVRELIPYALLDRL